MDAIPAMPVSPAPVTDAAQPREAKACESADAKGFGDHLKHEIAARSTDPKDEAAKDAPADDAATDAPADDKKQDAAATDTPPAIDPAVAALLADANAVQPQTVAVPVPVTPQATAAVTEKSDAPEAAAEIAAADAKPAGARELAMRGQRAPVDQA